MENTTIQALAVAEDVDKIFNEYSSAFNKRVTGMNMNMSMTPDIESSMEVPNDIQAYDRALAFVDITIDRFNTELRGESENISSAQGAQSGLEQLRNAMHNKEPPSNVLGIVHGQIHPNLQTAFGLELAMTM